MPRQHFDGPHLLTATEVREIVGPIDDLLVAQILGTGASAAELMEAYGWLGSDDHLGGDLERMPSGRVAALVEILQAELPDPEEA